MKILVLEGSPNKKGSTHLLADCFRQGAEEAGHTVQMLDIAHAKIHPCTGCIHCGYQGPCVQKDDMETIPEGLISLPSSSKGSRAASEGPSCPACFSPARGPVLCGDQRAGSLAFLFAAHGIRKGRPCLTEAVCFNRSSRRCGSAPPNHSRGCRRHRKRRRKRLLR